MRIELAEGPAASALLVEPGCRRQWDELHAACPWATAFQSLGFSETWYRAYATEYVPVLLRGFGESGGEPRQVVDLPSQHEDLRAAVAWVRGRDDVDADRVALWGNSLGGAHVISVAADDPRIVAVVAQIP